MARNQATLVETSTRGLDSEDLHRLNVKIWWEGSGIKKGGSMLKSSASKTKTIFILPGRIAWIPADITDRSLQLLSVIDSHKYIEINVELKVTLQSEKVVLLEYPSHLPNKKKPEKVSFQFNSRHIAVAFSQGVQEELYRRYITSANFTQAFEHELNTAIKTQINSSSSGSGSGAGTGGDGGLGSSSKDGDNNKGPGSFDSKCSPLKHLYLSCMNETCSPMQIVDVLFTNYRCLTDFEDPQAACFMEILSEVATDPVMLILFLCCQIEMNAQVMSDFKRTTGIPIQSYSHLLEQMLTGIRCITSRPNWEPKRKLFLQQFGFPYTSSSSGSGGANPRGREVPADITSSAVYIWSTAYTDSYRKMLLSSRVLNYMLADECFLCYSCLMHHADKGSVQMVQDIFPTVPHEYLFSSFDTERESGTDKKPHFVEFLFHRNLKDRNLFSVILQAFQEGSGYNDEFLRMFLHEAASRDGLRVAVDVLNIILFDANGEPSVQALKFCPKIPVTIFAALLKSCGISDASLGSGSAAGGAALSRRPIGDNARMLLEMCIRFEYVVLDTRLSYLKTLGKLFREAEPQRRQFLELVRASAFDRYCLDVCNHNLLGRDAATWLSAAVLSNLPHASTVDPAGASRESADSIDGAGANTGAGAQPAQRGWSPRPAGRPSGSSIGTSGGGGGAQASPMGPPIATATPAPVVVGNAVIATAQYAPSPSPSPHPHPAGHGRQSSGSSDHTDDESRQSHGVGALRPSAAGSYHFRSSTSGGLRGSLGGGLGGLGGGGDSATGGAGAGGRHSRALAGAQRAQYLRHGVRPGHTPHSVPPARSWRWGRESPQSHAGSLPRAAAWCVLPHTDAPAVTAAQSPVRLHHRGLLRAGTLRGWRYPRRALDALSG